MLEHKYDPHRKGINELKHTFICGEKLLDELTVELEPDRSGQLPRQSWIITGARGSGKSHLLVLLYHRVKESKTLSQYWEPLLFPEELYNVGSLYHLLIRVFELIFKSGLNDDIPPGIRSGFQTIKNERITGNLKEKNTARHRLAKELFQLLSRLKASTGKPFIFLLENLQDLLRDQLSDSDVRLLRSFMHEQPGGFIIIGTALTVFDEIDDYGKPFYNYFRLRVMERLDRWQVIQFLEKLADFRGDRVIRKRIDRNRRYIYLYHLLTGANPRLILFLYELLLDNEILDTYLILGRITELTPYFKDKTEVESGQRKLILDAMAMGAPAQTARDIAKYINEDQKSVAEQLKRLAVEGWVREIEMAPEVVKRNEVFYSIKDYFYRMWYRVRNQGIEASDILCLAELAVFLFDQKEIEERIQRYVSDHAGDGVRQILEKARDLYENEAFMRNINILLVEMQYHEDKEIFDLFNELMQLYLGGDGKRLIQLAGKMLQYPNKVDIGYFFQGAGYKELKQYDQAIDYFKRAIEVNPEFQPVWDNIIQCYFEKLDALTAYDAFSNYVDFKSDQGVQLADLRIFSKFKIEAPGIFNSSDELKVLFDRKATVSDKYEVICRLLLLGKFQAILDDAERLMKESVPLPGKEAKKLLFLLEAEMLEALNKKRQSPDLDLLLRYWARLSLDVFEYHLIRRKPIKFLVHCFELAGKKGVSYEAMETVFEQLYDEGFDMSEIVLKIFSAVKNPGTRESQQWKGDPLFAEVVQTLSF